MSDTKALALRGTPSAVDVAEYFSADQIALIRAQVAPKATPDEFKLFLYVAARAGLDPLSKQIYCIHRDQWDESSGKKVPKMTIQTSIDGLRLIADRTGRYMPGRDSTFTYVEGTENTLDPQILSATSYIKKLGPDGQWHEIPGTARFWEYAGTKADGNLTKMWDEKRHVMIAKCAEALAHRKAFPSEMCRLYIAEEMSRADVEYLPPDPRPPASPETRAVLEAANAKSAAILNGYKENGGRERDLKKSVAPPPASIAPPIVTNLGDLAAKEEANAVGPKGAAAPTNGANSTSTTTASAVQNAALTSAKAVFPGATTIDEEESADHDPPPVGEEDLVECFVQKGGNNSPWESIGPEPRRNAKQNNQLHALFADLELKKEDDLDLKGKPRKGIHSRLREKFGKWKPGQEPSTADLSERECEELIVAMKKRIESNRKLYGWGTAAERKKLWEDRARNDGRTQRPDGSWAAPGVDPVTGAPL